MQKARSGSKTNLARTTPRTNTPACRQKDMNFRTKNLLVYLIVEK